MSFKVDLSGFDELKRRLNDLENAAHEMDGKQMVKFDDLFTRGFMRWHTDFSSIDEMFKASGFKIQTAEDFKAIPEDQWNSFVGQKTRFQSWQEMQNKAAAE